MADLEPLESTAQEGVLVVKEDARVAHFTPALLLTITVVGWWALNAFVEMTGENRIAGNVLGALMSAAFLALWIYNARHPARLEISHPSIVERRRGRHRTTTLQRTTGELEFQIRTMVIGGHGSVAPILVVPDDPQTVIAIGNYDRMQVKQACEAMGWRFPEAE